MTNTEGPDGISKHKLPSQSDTATPENLDASPTMDTGGLPPASAPQPHAAQSRSIGPYRLIRKLGEGGMGQVWLAEQNAPLQRQVALKLIAGTSYDRVRLERFQSERQSLAIMDHPAIAKVFDAGSTPDGQPYFVMEYVPGVPITDYCDQRRLNVRDRLELFLKVCDGVQHAHQKAILHRDLKPANILVIEIDGAPAPRIIDFGLAKPLTTQDAAEAMRTQTGAFVGTPAYMSPEQADPGAHGIDTRADVYSLGVVLYELLIGLLPLDPQQWHNERLGEVLRQLREKEPQRPSVRIETQKAALPRIAQLRRASAKQLLALLRGDLDCIVMRSLEKDPARRYGTPGELAADVRRFLNSEPVMARPANVGYRLQKYLRRHWVSVSAAGGFALLLAGFAVFQTFQLHRITRERDRAVRVTDFLTGMFNSSDPAESRGDTITAREVLDRASKNINASLTQDPDLQSYMMDTMGKIYHNLRIYGQSQTLLEQAIEVRRRAFGPNSRETLSSMFGLVMVLRDEGRTHEAETLAHQTLQVQKRALGDDDPDTLKTEAFLGVILADDAHYAEAEALQRKALERQSRILGPRARDPLTTMLWLARTLEKENRMAEALNIFRQAVDIESQAFGPDYPLTVSTMGRMSEALRDSGRYDDAAKMERSVIEADRRLYGSENLETLASEEDLGDIMFYAGEYAGAEKIFYQVLAFRTRVQGPDNRDTLESWKSYADSIADQRNRPAKAEALLRQGLERAERTLGPDHRLTLSFMGDLAGSLGDVGQFAEAEKLLRHAREIDLRKVGLDNPETAVTTYNLACIEARMHRNTNALALLREAMNHGLLPASALAIESDPDLKALHGDPRFAALVRDAKKLAAGAEKAAPP